MKCCVLIMSCNKEPAIRNVNMAFNTYVKMYNDNKALFNNDYDFIEYVGGGDKDELINNKLILNVEDDVYHTFEKTIKSFKYLSKLNIYDFIIRVNISTYVNMFALDYLISNYDKDNIYCNSIITYYNSTKYMNNIAPRGDAYIITKELVDKIIHVVDNQYDVFNDDLSGIEHTDDALLGLVLLKIFDNKTYNHIKLLNYSFIPEIINVPTKSITLAGFVCFSRIKSCPPGSFSGYSWDDNQYRLFDVGKFKVINNFMLSNINYFKHIKYDNLLNFDDSQIYIYNNGNNIEPHSFEYIVSKLNGAN